MANVLQAPLNLHLSSLVSLSYNSKAPDNLKQPGLGGRLGSSVYSCHRCPFADFREPQRVPLWRSGVAGGCKGSLQQLYESRPGLPEALPKRRNSCITTASGESHVDVPSATRSDSIVFGALPKNVVSSALLLLSSSSAFVVLPLVASAETLLTQAATPKLASNDLGGISVPLFVAPGTSSYYGSVSDVPSPRLHAGWVVDDARVMSDSQKAHIEQVAQRVKEASGAEIAVVTVDQIAKSTSPKSFATSLFNKWGIGSAQNNNGVLVFLVKDRRRLEIEIGRGLNGPFNKASWLKKMQQEKMVPLLKMNDFGGGLVSGVDGLAEKLSLIEANPQEFAAASRSDADGLAGSLLLFLFGGWLVIDRIKIDRELKRKLEEIERAESLREQEMESLRKDREARAEARAEEYRMVQEAREANWLQMQREREEASANFWSEVKELKDKRARAGITPEERRKDEEARAKAKREQEKEEEARARKRREKERKEKEARKKRETGSYTGSGSSYIGSSSSYEDVWSGYGGSSYGSSSSSNSGSYGGSSYDSSSSSSSDSGSFDGGSSDGGGCGSDF